MIVAKNYQKYQQNGTISIESVSELSEQQKQELNEGAGEIFLSKIPAKMAAEELFNIACKVGPVYRLRVKIDFFGKCRGFAFLQYMDPGIFKKAIMHLPAIFNSLSLRINVKKSTNARILVLRYVAHHINPLKVYQELLEISHHIKLQVHEYQPNRFLYLLVYRNNDQAAQGHHNIRLHIRLFGKFARILWLNQKNNLMYKPSKCCLPLERSNLGNNELANLDCKCFNI